MNTILKITLAVVGIGFMLVLLLFGTFFVRQVAYAMPMNWRTPFYNQSGPGPFPPGSDYRGMWGRGGMHPGTGSFQMPWGQNGCRGYDDGYVLVYVEIRGKEKEPRDQERDPTYSQDCRYFTFQGNLPFKFFCI